MSTSHFNVEGVKQIFAVYDDFLGRIVLQDRNGKYHLHVGSLDVEVELPDDGMGELINAGMGTTSIESEMGLWEKAWRSISEEE